MSKNIIVIGGVALGPKAACRCMRLDPEAKVTLFDENTLISYGGCGIPYFVGGDIQNVKELCSTPYQTLRNADFFKSMKGFDVHTRTRVTKIDRQAKTVTARSLDTGEEKTYPYDKIVLATGAKPRMPNVPGGDLENVFTLTKLEAADAIKALIEKGKISSAVVVGGGFIGLEAAVAMADMWGVKVAVVEMMDHILPGVLDSEYAHMATHDLAAHGVEVYTGEQVVRMEGDKTVSKVVTDKRELDADLVIFSAGFLPNGQLAKDCGLEVDGRGAILVNDHMQTSDPDIYAGGDCCSIKNIITGKPGYLPLGSMANRQGRVIGSNLAGLDQTFPGYVGSWAVKLFDLSFVGAGLTVETAKRMGYDAVGTMVEQLDRAHFYPVKEMCGLQLVADRKDGRVLGIQGVSKDPQAVKARVDAVAAVLQNKDFVSVADISNLEASYAPPFAAAMDVVNAVGNAMENVLAGRTKVITSDEFMDLWEHRDENNFFFIDCRPQKAGDAVQARHPDWHAISLEGIHTRWNEVPADRPVAIICNTGLRAYDAVLVLAKHGIKDTYLSMGGMQSVIKTGREV
ncbi:MAG: FAD-dependent oxidoreductase [Desulfovibrio sp.]|nr:FAD-dependent oxidoreductase [Desulfovibrio sp.]